MGALRVRAAARMFVVSAGEAGVDEGEAVAFADEDNS